MTVPEVHIHYRRPPDREDVYVQLLLLDHPEVKITYQPSTPVSGPVEVDGAVILEPGSPVVWFTFPDTWHDIGRFHTADGAFTGIYANVLSPCRLHGPDDPAPLRWETTDLFLDVWVGRGARPRILDQEDLEAAVRSGAVSPEVAARARREADDLVSGWEEGRWPPSRVESWTLERARESLG